MWAVSMCLGLAAHKGPRRAGCFVVRTPHAALPCPPQSRTVPTLSWSVWGSLGRQPGPGVPAGLLGYEVTVTGQAGQAQLGSQPCGQRPRRVSGVAQGKWPEAARLCLQVGGGRGLNRTQLLGLGSLGVGESVGVWDSLPRVSPQVSRGPFSPCGSRETVPQLVPRLEGCRARGAIGGWDWGLFVLGPCCHSPPAIMAHSNTLASSY